MSEKILPFSKVIKENPVEDVSGEIRMGSLVRVLNVLSPFFTWEGYVTNMFDGPFDTGKFVQILCAHKGVEFPIFTFNIDAVILVPQNRGRSA